MRISVKCGSHRKDLDFPIPAELEEHLFGLLKVEDAEKGRAFNVEGSRTVKVRLTTYGFEKDL